MGLGASCWLSEGLLLLNTYSGKTVQMSAGMAMNMPSPDERHRGTLIVVPAALLTQVRAALAAPRC